GGVEKQRQQQTGYHTPPLPCPIALQGVAKPYRARGLKREGVEKEIKSTGKYPPLSGGEDTRD
ncbi:hypothetical protein, partial [Barnesiella intestinihominis]